MELGIADVNPSGTASDVRCTHQLHGQKQNGLHCELKVAMNKEIFKRLAEAVDHHRIKSSFRTKPMDMSNTSPSIERCVDLKLVAQSVILSFNSLEFNDNVVSR